MHGNAGEMHRRGYNSILIKVFIAVQPLEYCYQKLSHGRNVMAFRFPFLSRSQRQALIVLYALQQELQDVVQDCSQADLALTTLSWWEKQINGLFASTDKPEHPLMQALLPLIGLYCLPQSELQALIDAYRTELTQARFQNMAQLRRYAAAAGMVQGRLSSRVLGFSVPQTLDFAGKVGETAVLVRLFSRIGADARQGKLYIPVETLQAFNVPAHLVINRQGGAEFKTLLYMSMAELQQQIKSVVAMLPSADRRRQRVSLAVLATIAALLEEIRLDGVENIMNYQLIVPRARQQRLAWKTWLFGFNPVG